MEKNQINEIEVELYLHESGDRLSVNDRYSDDTKNKVRFKLKRKRNKNKR